MTDKIKQSSSAEMSKQIAVERLQYLLDQVKEIIPHLHELEDTTSQARQDVQSKITQFAMSIKLTKLKPEELDGFFKKPYCIVPAHADYSKAAKLGGRYGRADQWYVIVPKFVDIQIGWLERATESFNIFLVNRYVDWLGELPKSLKDELGFKDPLDIFIQGEYLTGRDLEKAKERYGKFIRKREGDKLLIDKKKHFELLASLIRDGILPFTPASIPQEYLVDDRKVDFELRDYQMDAWKKFLKYGNIGAFFPASTGKTFLALYAMAHIKPPHLIAVPTVLLKEQWKERIELYTDLKPDEYVLETYQSAVKKYGDREFSILIVDEAHHLPANEFSKLSFIKRKFTLGLSATPQREDHREEFIFALTGYPVGLSWDHFKQLGIIQSPTCHVWIIKNFTAKIEKLKELLQEEKKTIIFSDSIELGRTVAARFDIPHVYGETKKRLSTIQDAPVSVVSRVGDEGVSLPDIKRVIEVSWLFGSRRQELQRFTRLLHGRGSEQAEHHILMTMEEYSTQHKRLFGIMDKGFKIVIHREGISEKVFLKQTEESLPRQRKPVGRSPTTKVDTNIPTDIPTNIPTNTSGILALPGIQKQMKLLDKTQRKVWTLLLQNDGRWYTTREMCMLLGYANASHFGLRSMLAKKMIEKKGDQYRTNFSNMANLQDKK